MVGDAFRKVQSGQRLRIPAAAYNAFIDAARMTQRGIAGAGDPATVPPDRSTVLVQNQSGEPRARFDVLGIGAPIIGPVANADEFTSRIAVTGVTPAAGHVGRFAVLLEPLGPGAIGRAIIAGATIVRVEMISAADTFAEIIPGTYTRLRSAGGAGSAQLLWVQPIGEWSVSNIAWAIARLGAPTVAPGTLFAVLVTTDGGSAGSISTTCSFTYTVTSLGGIVLGTGVSPQQRRFPNVIYTTTPPGSAGLAYRDASNTLRLWSANELPDLEVC